MVMNVNWEAILLHYNWPLAISHEILCILYYLDGFVVSFLVFISVTLTDISGISGIGTGHLSYMLPIHFGACLFRSHGRWY